MSELTQGERESIVAFAPNAPYVFACPDCKTWNWNQRDCKTTKAVRNGTLCADCDTQIVMVKDAKQ